MLDENLFEDDDAALLKKRHEDKCCFLVLEHTKIMSDMVGGLSLQKARLNYNVDLNALAQQADLRLAKLKSVDDVIDMINYLHDNNCINDSHERIHNLIMNGGM